MIDERNISSAAEFIAIHSFRPTLHEVGITQIHPLTPGLDHWLLSVRRSIGADDQSVKIVSCNR